MGGEWGGVNPSTSDSGVWESVMSSLCEENSFIVILSWQIASVDSR